jgi:hypothetical protein
MQRFDLNFRDLDHRVPEPVTARQQLALCSEDLYSPTHYGDRNDDAGDGQGVLQGR